MTLLCTGASEAEEVIDRDWLKNAGLSRLATKFEGNVN